MQTLLVIIGRLANVQVLDKLPLIVPLTSEYRTLFGNNWKREKVNGVLKRKFYRQSELSAVSWSLTSSASRVPYDLALSARSSITSLLGQRIKRRLPNFYTRFPHSRLLWFWKADVIFFNLWHLYDFGWGTGCLLLWKNIYDAFLTFMGTCIVIIFWYIIPTRCRSHRIYLTLRLLMSYIYIYIYIYMYTWL